MKSNTKSKKHRSLSCGMTVISVFLAAILFPNSVDAEDTLHNSVPDDSVRTVQAMYFAEDASPADPRLHEAIINGLTNKNRPKLEDDFLLKLRGIRQGEGSIFVWDRSLTDTSVAGAHLAEYIILVLPFTLPEGEKKILFGDPSQTSTNVYAIYTDTELAWFPILSCIGLAVDGVVTFNNISPNSIEADMDISFELVGAIEWKSSNFCKKRNIEAQVMFARKELEFWKFPGQNTE